MIQSCVSYLELSGVDLGTLNPMAATRNPESTALPADRGMPTYRVFLSSTFADFKVERTRLPELINLLHDVKVIAAHLEGDRGEPKLDTLRKLIDGCDIVVLLIGSRSGSKSDTGQTWTKEEVDYALAKGKRVFAYIRELPAEVLALTDRNADGELALNSLIDEVDKKIALVQRYKYGECCKLTAMVIRDVQQCVADLTHARQAASYDQGFEG
jgi:nucleoside 2-deoxyribosyltransferase